MKTVGIIAEYNPFHNGHAYQLQRAKELSGADYAIVVMSGDFVQRGEPALLDKYTRTRMALSCGADLVIEMPVCYATSSAELFAASGVSLLDHLGCDYLCFGSECGSIEPLEAIAQVLAKEPPVFREALQSALKEGNTYPQAMSLAYQKATGNAESAQLFSSPNNLLGIEYLKAIHRRHSSMKPLTLPRIGQSYHAQEAAERYSSASAIRGSLQNGCSIEQLSKWIPREALAHFQPDQMLWMDDFSLLMDDRRLFVNDYSGYAGVSEDLANRIAAIGNRSVTFTELTAAVKTRQYTYSHISRALLHILLQITKEHLEHGKQADFAPYIRILGVRRNSTALLRQIREHTDLPLINKLADAAPDLLLELDIRSAHLYRSVLYHKSGILLPDEYRAGVCLL